MNKSFATNSSLSRLLFKLAILVLSTGLNLADVFSQVNLLTNGGFEEGTTGWSVWGATMSLSDDAYSGNSAVKISNRKNPWDALARNITPLLKSGKEYKLSFYAKFPEPASNLRATLGITINGVNSYHAYCWTNSPVTGKYSLYEQTFLFEPLGPVSNINLYFETDAVNAKYTDYYIDDIFLEEMEPDTGVFVFPGPGLKSIKSTMKIGGCVTDGSKHYFNSQRAKYQVLHDCNTATVQCYPAWGRWDEQNKYVYHVEEFSNRARELKENGILVTAHMLSGWDQYFPAWYKEHDFETDTLDRILKTWIEAIIGSNGNDTLVDTWNVVNETISWDGKGGYWPLYSADFNSSCEFQRLGFEADASGLPSAMIVNNQHPVYIRKAFEYARVYTDKKLELRDASIEFPTDQKYKAFYQLVVHLLKTGTPLDVVGLQTHIDLGKAYDWDGFTENIRRYRALGLEVIIPEVDLGDTQKEWSDEKAELQKMAYYHLVTAAIKGGASELQTWGFIDGNSGWRAGENAFPYSNRYVQKPAYFGIMEALMDMSHILYWEMDEAHHDTLPDVMTYNNHGLLRNFGEPGFVNGFKSKALSFDGIDDYILTDSLSEPVAGDFTLSFLLFPETEKEAILVSMIQQDTSLIRLGLDETGSLYLEAGGQILNPGISLDDSTWHFIAVRRDSTSLQLFIDSDTAIISREIPVIPFNELCIGAEMNTSLAFKGIMDEFRLYNTRIDEASYRRNLAPMEPMNLSLSSSKMLMRLSWLDRSMNEEGFIVERKITGGSWEVVRITGPGIKNIADTITGYETVYSYRVKAFNRFGESAYTNTKKAVSPADPSTGTESIENTAPLLNLYPNPVQDIFYIDDVQLTSVTIYDPDGRQVFKKHSLTPGEPIHIGHLPNGIYFVKTIGSGTGRILKLVKI